MPVPAMLAGREVFFFTEYVYRNRAEAQAACGQYGAPLATLAQVTDAFYLGAESCSWGYTASNDANGNALAAFPMQSAVSGCSTSKGVQQAAASTLFTFAGNGVIGAACYGVKPARGTAASIGAFNTGANRWSVYDPI